MLYGLRQPLGERESDATGSSGDQVDAPVSETWLLFRRMCCHPAGQARTSAPSGVGGGKRLPNPSPGGELRDELIDEPVFAAAFRLGKGDINARAPQVLVLQRNNRNRSEYGCLLRIERLFSGDIVQMI